MMNSIFTFIIIGTLFAKGEFPFSLSYTVAFNLFFLLLINAFFLTLFYTINLLFMHALLFTIDLSTSLLIHTYTNTSISV